MSAQPRLNEGADAALDAGADVVNQALRREVNERIRSISDDFAVAEPETLQLVCECARAGCVAMIVMRVADYELVRRFPTRFFVKQGHEVAQEARVVSGSADYIVVEAGGRGGLYAVGSDPRRANARHTEVDR
jgi:hypothetical protein